MRTSRRLATGFAHQDATSAARTAIGESLLLRFLVQRGIVHHSLLKLIEVERAGAGTSLSLVDWLVQRGHVSEAALTSVLAACLKLQPDDLAPFARRGEGGRRRPAGTRARTPHLKLVHSRRTSSGEAPAERTRNPVSGCSAAHPEARPPAVAQTASSRR